MRSALVDVLMHCAQVLSGIGSNIVCVNYIYAKEQVLYVCHIQLPLVKQFGSTWFQYVNCFTKSSVSLSQLSH